MLNAEYRLLGDITSKDEIGRLVGEVQKQESKGVHPLVNNAGIARDDRRKYSNRKPHMKSAQSISEHLWKSDLSDWAATFKINITARLLAKAGQSIPDFSPSIVKFTCISGVLKGSSNGQFAYATSKAGLIHLTRMMVTTFAEAKIRVNLIAPGIFSSEMTAGESNEH
jgi:NAD(P)-dependent dehydrogenase (short-subunit alcohol dehydrogenase family)